MKLRRLFVSCKEFAALGDLRKGALVGLKEYYRKEYNSGADRQPMFPEKDVLVSSSGYITSKRTQGYSVNQQIVTR